MLRRLSLAALALAAAAALAPADEAGPTELVVLTNGFPGLDREEESRQLVTTDGERLRAVDPAHLRAVYVSRTEGLIHDVDLARREYSVHPFAEYAELRAKRERTRAAQLRQWEKARERADSEAERVALDEELRDLGLRPDGEVVIHLEEPGERRELTLDLDGEERRVTLRRVLLRENEAARPVLDMWVTTDVAPPVDLLGLYADLGLFSPAVQARLAQVRGAVLEATLTLDDGSFARGVRCAIQAVRRDPPAAPGDLRLPEGLTEVDPDAPPPAGHCETCRAPLEEGRSHYRFRGRSFCSREHRLEYVRARVAGQ